MEAVQERAQRFCEACGSPMRGKMDYHHRKPRSRGGDDTVDNLIWVHHICHVGSAWAIHANPTRSYRLHHTLYTHEDPAEVPFLTEANLRVLRA